MNYLNLRFTAREEIFTFPFNDETLLIPTPDNVAEIEQIVAVNDTGLLFWRELMSGKTPNEICILWAEKSGVALAELQHIALNLLSILKPILKEATHEE